MDTLPSLSLVRLAISSNEYSSANFTAEFIALVANSVVFRSAISINVGLIPLSIIHILRKTRIQTIIKDIINIVLAWGGDRRLLLKNRCTNSKTPLKTIYACIKRVRLVILTFLAKKSPSSSV